MMVPLVARMSGREGRGYAPKGRFLTVPFGSYAAWKNRQNAPWTAFHCVHRAGARGIDAAAVMGSGLCNLYPRENLKLFRQIADGRGAVISELPVGEATAAMTTLAIKGLIARRPGGVFALRTRPAS